MKPISDLIFEDTAWTMVQEWIRNSQTNIHVLENTRTIGEEVLFNLQITNKSTMGAIVLECGGIIVDHGWLYILGSGHQRIFGSVINNRQLPLLEEGYVVAYDVLGGLFAINKGQFDDNSRNIYYFAPDTLEWEDTGKGYTDFINWVFHGDLNKYYELFRWESWKEDLKDLAPDQGISIFPYLWANEGMDIENRHKQLLEIKEIWGLQSDFRNKFKEKL